MPGRPPPLPGDTATVVAWLCTPAAVRSRADALLARAEDDRLDHFALDLDRLDAAADTVAEVTRAAYPTLEVPPHSRWRHFAAGGVDRWPRLAAGLGGVAADEVARIRIDLAVTSVLLDAGAGAGWRYVEPGTGVGYSRSEGLAVAAFHLFAGGAFSARADAPLRADAVALEGVDEAALARGLQVSADNPLVGLAGRARLLQRLATALRARPDLFGAEARVGCLFDHLVEGADGVTAAGVLAAVLDGLGPVWAGGPGINGPSLGDVWPHPAFAGDWADGLVPFHKLAQWLTYSLVEPLEDAGVRVAGLDELTGLAEYRNGGLFVDLGVLRPNRPGLLDAVYAVDSEVVVEWRALTVALLDRLAPRVRDRLGLDPQSLPLAKVLEGGTWSAGRHVAALSRPGGEPPIRVASDGTVF